MKRYTGVLVAQELDPAGVWVEASEALSEVERLRAELAERASPGALQDMFARLNDTEAKLAAANALPGRIWEALGELTSYLVDGDHMVRVDEVRRTFEARLAGQTATPSNRTCPACKRGNGGLFDEDVLPHVGCSRARRESCVAVRAGIIQAADGCRDGNCDACQTAKGVVAKSQG